MKLFIILAVTAICNGAKLDRTYLPPNAQTSGGTDAILQTPLSQQPLQNIQPSRNPVTSYSGSENYRQQIGQPNGVGPSFAPVDQSNVYSPKNNGAQNPAYQANGFNNQANGYNNQANGFNNQANGFNNQADGFNNQARYMDKPERAQAAFERNAAILRQNNENDGERYSYAYETENGIYAEENGVATNGVEAQGGFSYTGDDGRVYSIRYTADQNGFLPQGDHLPTPPPVPEEILKALEQNARDEAAGIYDDGTYNEAKYASEDSQGYNFNAQNQYSNINNQVNNDAIAVNSAIPSRPNNGFSRTGSNAPGLNRVNNNIPARENVAPSFGKPSSTLTNNAPFGSAASSFGRNTPSFANTALNNLPINSPAGSLPTFGSSRPTSPVYGTPVSSGISAPNFGRTAPTAETAVTGFERKPSAAEATAPAFGQRTFGAPANTGSARTDIEKAYLPPFQRTPSQNGFGRTQAFNEKDGYRY